MRRLAELLVAAALVLAVVLLWPRGGSGEKPPFYADPVRTPGALNPDVTQATIRSTICVRGWTATVRPPSSYTDDLKLKQMAEYGVGGSPSGYQEDHLISLELGGSPSDPRNLWPQPRPWADDVDQTENELNDRVCSGQLTLAEAQARESALKHGTG
ncbi:MAG TPA: hypothetical protein VFI37_02630 [Gaiellaceae bacterium]|nr:hypothetical protein [Gaiellaceae bacterium]